MTAVYRGLTQQALDLAYDQDHWAPNAGAVQARIIARSGDVAGFMPPLTLRYGPAEPQLVDIFTPPDADGAPVVILIHGGAWQLSMRAAFYGAAPAITAAGCIVAVVGFGCRPALPIVGMAEQIRQAVAWIAAEIGAYGGDPHRLHLVGHSSGAHLAAVTLTGAVGPAIRGATLISGLYDMEPVMLSSRRLYMGLTGAEADDLSPIRHTGALACPVSLWWGAQESPEFQRQSQAFADAAAHAGRLDRATMLDGRNHFEMLEELENPGSPVLAAMLASALS